MKVCKRCKKELPSKDFPPHKRCRDGLSNICRRCTKARDYAREEFKEKEREKEKLYEKATGGLKIYILNYPCRGEKKFNICSTDEWYYSTDNKDDFLRYLELHI